MWLEEDIMAGKHHIMVLHATVELFPVAANKLMITQMIANIHGTDKQA